MSCSGTKRADTLPLAAIDRYDGPMWRTLRTSLERNPRAASAYADGELQIWVLSALYGFIDSTMEIPDYDRLMTPTILKKMARDCSCDFQHIAGMVDRADATLFAGGAMYRDAMWSAAGCNLSKIAKVSETDGRGIGEHRAQLGAWLKAQYGRAGA